MDGARRGSGVGDDDVRAAPRAGVLTPGRRLRGFCVLRPLHGGLCIQHLGALHRRQRRRALCGSRPASPWRRRGVGDVDERLGDVRPAHQRNGYRNHHPWWASHERRCLRHRRQLERPRAQRYVVRADTRCGSRTRRRRRRRRATVALVSREPGTRGRVGDRPRRPRVARGDVASSWSAGLDGSSGPALIRPGGRGPSPSRRRCSACGGARRSPGASCGSTRWPCSRPRRAASACPRAEGARR